MRLFSQLGLVLSVFCCTAVSAFGDAAPQARLLRFPDLHNDVVVFVYAGDLWRAPSRGGEAVRLTSHPGQELFPKISPDGQWIAFSAEYTGTRQVYVMPIAGGTPRQLTYYNDVGPAPPRAGWDNWILGWTRDGKILVRMNRVPWSSRMGRYFLVDPRGGLETPLELPEGGSASLSPDGKQIAYCPIDREFRTWKRTRGGRAQDIWRYDFTARRSERLTDDPGTDNFPMWSGDTIYFTSDREHTLNLYALDIKTKRPRRITDFNEYDVLWPSLGPGGIVFMNGGYLYRFDLASEKATQIPITLGTALDALAPQWKDAAGDIDSFELSPSGTRVLFGARGDVFTVPVKDGAPRNLTRTSGVREQGATWSPDGQWIAYLSDASGEYEIYLQPQAGGAARRLTRNGAVWRFAPVWSPNSQKLAFGDASRRLWILDVGSGALTEVDRSAQGDINTYVWSPDSRWLAYEKNRPEHIPGIAVYSLAQKKTMLLGDSATADGAPAWSDDGKYLFFASDRDYRPTFSSFEFNYVYRDSTRVYVAALDAEVPALFPPKSDEETGPAKTDAGKKPSKDEAKKPAPVVVNVSPAGWDTRTVALPGVTPGNYRRLRAAADALYYLKFDTTDADGPSGGGALMRYDLKERKEEKVIDSVRDYELSRDGKKVLYRSKDDWFVADAKAGIKAGEGKVDTSGLRVKLDQRAEWNQIWNDGWRIARDWFYDPKMHGTDWAGLKKRYGALVPYVGNRADLDFLLGELLSELDSGHTYVESGDEPSVKRVLGGMLGCELTADTASRRYRIATVFAGENWDERWRSPLTEPGVDVKAGSYLLAIDGEELKTDDNPYRLLEGKAGMPVTLRVAADPSGKGARSVTVRPIASEANLRYLDWVRSRMALVERLSGGKIGYLHLPDTALAGNRALQKYYYAQISKPALIVDDRYNGGGFIPDRMIEYFSRTTMAYWVRRDIEPMRTPGFAHNGPKAMLVNGYSSSGGDALPYFFRLKGLGPLIGTRTWGGLIGLSGGPRFLDGGAVDIPTFRIFDTTGKWVVENEGVTPDIEVYDLPESRIAGGDPSIERAVKLLLEELAKQPVRAPTTPVPPNLAK